MTPQPVIYSNRLRNVPTAGLFWGSDTNFYAPFHIEQWYIDDMIAPHPKPLPGGSVSAVRVYATYATPICVMGL